MRSLFAFVLLLFGVAVPQEIATMPFVLDARKPYVYLAFDHTGPRTPIQMGEGKQGLWLKFVNNCRVPVTVGTFDPGTGEPGIGVIDEIVPIPTSGSGGAPKSGRTIPRVAAKPPEGYAATAEVHSATTVQPGDSILFSVPLNHVSPRWLLRVRFSLEVADSKIGDQPYSYAEFRWEQLPQAVGRAKK